MKRGLSLFLALLFLLSLSSCNRMRRPGEGEILVEFLDVGEADCTLIRTEDTTVLIDTGGPDTASRVLRYLDRAGIKKIDCLVLSHAHSDHIGGASALLSTLPVDTCLMPYDAPDTDAFRQLLAALKSADCRVREAYRGRSFTFGEIILQILAPDMYATAGENAKSVALRLEYRGNSFLFMGDCGIAEEQEILAHYGSEALSSQLLKVGHHGSRAATGTALLSAVSPSIAVISCGTGNSYGFPHAELLGRLSAAGCRVLRTDTHGKCTVLGNGTDVMVLQ